MEELKSFFKKPLVLLAGLAGILLAIIKYLIGRNHELEAKVDNSESEKKDAVLKQQQSDLSEENKQDLAELEKQRGQKLTDEEMTEWLKKL